MPAAPPEAVTIPIIPGLFSANREFSVTHRSIIILPLPMPINTQRKYHRQREEKIRPKAIETQTKIPKISRTFFACFTVVDFGDRGNAESRRNKGNGIANSHLSGAKIVFFRQSGENNRPCVHNRADAESRYNNTAYHKGFRGIFYFFYLFFSFGKSDFI